MLPLEICNFDSHCHSLQFR